MTTRGTVLLLVKMVLAGGLLYYVLSTRLNESAKRDLTDVFLHAPGNLLGALGVFSFQLLIGAQRLRILLRAQGLSLTYWNTLRLTYLGAFFDTFMVTSVGGDAIKAIYLARECPPGQKVENVSVLLLDRLLGLLGLLTLMVSMTLLYIRPLWADDDIRPLLPYVMAVPLLLLIGTLMLLSRRVYHFAAMQWMLKKMPFGHFADRAYRSLQQFRHKLDIVIQCWALSLAAHTCGVTAGFLLLSAMHQDPSFGPFLVAWFISGFIVSFAPFGGIGFGQGLFDIVFRKIADVQNGWVLATAMQAVAILAKSPGLIAWLLSREHTEAAVQEPPKTNADLG